MMTSFLKVMIHQSSLTIEKLLSARLPSCTFVNHKSRLNLILVIIYKSLSHMSHFHESYAWVMATINKKHTHHINYFLHSCLLSCNLGIISFKSIWNKCISGFQFCDTSVFRFWGWISRVNFSEFSGVKVNFKNSEGKFSRILEVNFNVH